MAAAPVPLSAVEIREWLAGKGIDRNVKQIYPLLSRLRLPFKRSRCAAPVHGEPNDKVITKTHLRLKLSDAEVAALGDRLREETDPGYRARLAALNKVGTTQEKMSAIAYETRSLDDLSFTKKDITNITALIRAILGKSEPLFRSFAAECLESTTEPRNGITMP